MNEKYRFLKGALCGALAMLCIITAVNGIRKTVVSAVPQLSVINEKNEDGKFSEEKLQRIRAVIDSIYLREDEIDDAALTEGMYEGYVRALGDPYSVYFTEEEARELMQGISGELLKVNDRKGCLRHFRGQQPAATLSLPRVQVERVFHRRLGRRRL